jgi:hypothetical protein
MQRFVSTLVAGTLAVSTVLGPASLFAQQLPVEQRQGEVAYVTGGITSDEAAAFRAASPNYTLALEMSQPSREQVSDIVVSITDRGGGEVLRTQADGPFVLAKLPPGDYDIRADNAGDVRSQAVNITPGQNRHVLLRW